MDSSEMQSNMVKLYEPAEKILIKKFRRESSSRAIVIVTCTVHLNVIRMTRTLDLNRTV